jgi:two-component sensor histidine kinase
MYVCGERATNAIALIFHGLATNAAKYSALNLETGCVAKEGQRQKEMLMFDWVERHEPPIEGPTSGEGFGGELLRRMVEQFGRTISYDWQRAGFATKIVFPRTPCHISL